MNIEKLNQARELLRKEFDLKLTGTKNHHLLIDAVNSLDILIKRLNEPAHAKKMDKLCGVDNEE
jgi:hypothetical protein